MIKWIGVIILGALMIGNASGATLTVNASGGAMYTRIQDAIDNASAGDTIEVYSGIYYENINVTKQITLRGMDTGNGKPVVDGGNRGNAITLSEDGITLEGFTATNAGGFPAVGILISSNNNTIRGNNASNNFDGGLSDGIAISGSYNNIIGNNTIIGNTANDNLNGIWIGFSNNNTITNNTANLNSNYGIRLYRSSNNNLSNNTMSENYLNFGVEGFTISSFIQNIDTTNKVNGKPVYYWVNQHDTQISGDAGYVGIVNSNNITVKNLTLINNGQGVLFANTTNSSIENVNASSNSCGIRVSFSNNNKINGNIATFNQRGRTNYNYPDYYDYGICLYASSNNTVTNNNVSNNNGYGIRVDRDDYNILLGNNNNITGNKANNNLVGFSIVSNNNNVSDNIANSNYWDGIDIYHNNNIITGNSVSNNNGYGIYLSYSANSYLSNNVMSENHFNFGVYGDSLSFIQNIDTTNKVNGKPVYYWVNQQDKQIPSDAGYVGVVNSNNITVKNLTLANNGQGILLVNTSNSRIENVNASNNQRGIDLGSSGNNNNTIISTIANNNKYEGIVLSYSSNNIITGSKANNNGQRGLLLGTSSNNTIIGNNASNNNYDGISIYSSSNNTIIGNNVSNNDGYGIYIYLSNNSIYNNLFNNHRNFYFYYTIYENTWNSTKALGTNIIGGLWLGGNYWGNPDGTGFSQTCIDADNDGICDSAYVLDANNTDYLPLSLNFTTTIPSASTIGYSALVATGQNTYVQSSNGTFGLLLKGQTKTIANSVILNNMGDLSAKVEARFSDSIAGIYGLISGVNVLNASNFALGVPGAPVPLGNGGANVQVAVAPPGATALDARLSVPSNQTAGDYTGTVILTFSNNI